MSLCAQLWIDPRRDERRRLPCVPRRKRGFGAIAPLPARSATADAGNPRCWKSPMLEIKVPEERVSVHGRNDSTSTWITPVAMPLDLEGPVAVPFDQPQADFVEQPIDALFDIVAAR